MGRQEDLQLDARELLSFAALLVNAALVSSAIHLDVVSSVLRVDRYKIGRMILCDNYPDRLTTIILAGFS